MTKRWGMVAGAPLIAAMAAAGGAQTQSRPAPLSPPPAPAPAPAPGGLAPHGNGMVSHQSSGEAVTVPNRARGYRPVVLVRKGTPIALRIAEDVAARERPLEAGDRVRLEVAEPVRWEEANLVPRPAAAADGEARYDIGPSVAGSRGVLVPAGRPAIAVVTEAAGGRLAIRLLSVSIHGDDVALRGTARGTLLPGTRVEGAFADDFVPAQPLMPMVAPGGPVQVLEAPRPHSIAIPARMPPPDPRIAAPPVPKAPLAALIAEADYPEPALRARAQGEATLILEVAPSGRVVTCVVTYPTRSDALNAASCRLLHARARFTPARDTNGNAIAAWIEHKVRWSLPGTR